MTFIENLEPRIGENEVTKKEKKRKRRERRSVRSLELGASCGKGRMNMRKRQRPQNHLQAREKSEGQALCRDGVPVCFPLL